MSLDVNGSTGHRETARVCVQSEEIPCKPTVDVSHV